MNAPPQLAPPGPGASADDWASYRAAIAPELSEERLARLLLLLAPGVRACQEKRVAEAAASAA